MIILFDEKKHCCSCTACMNICPKQAIKLNPDNNGFSFPEINRDLCIECGLCNKVCAFQYTPVTGKEPIATYVAINKNKDMLLRSASGGVLGALASIVLDNNGVVFGCAYNNYIMPIHICIDNKLDIKKIQGSKYVHSDVNNTYKETKKYLREGTQVLFTGTPCQIAGLKSYLGKDYENLLTVDIICHGVPNADFFKGYIQYLEYKLKGKVIDFKFRDKSKGWGLRGKVIYERNGKKMEKVILPSTSYYYSYFLKGDIYRENCYECKYACGSREGDFTIGDYWGVEKIHPEVETKGGVSTLLVNSNKGRTLIDELSKHLNLTQSTFENARKQNGQLNKPTDKSDKRDAIFKTWQEGGYRAVADEYYKLNKKQIILTTVKESIPFSMRVILKKTIKKLTLETRGSKKF